MFGGPAAAGRRSRAGDGKQIFLGQARERPVALVGGGESTDGVVMGEVLSAERGALGMAAIWGERCGVKADLFSKKAVDGSAGGALRLKRSGGRAVAQWSGGVVEWWCDALGCHGWQRAATRLCQKLGGDTAGRELPGNYGAFWGQNA